jgi:hypothetical protein
MVNHQQDEITETFAQLEANMTRLRELLAARSIATTTTSLRDTKDLIDTGAAMKLTGRSSSWLYATAKDNPALRLGWKAGNSYVWSRSRLKAFMFGQLTALIHEGRILRLASVAQAADLT